MSTGGWPWRRVVLWVGIAAIGVGVCVELAREYMERPLFANIYGVSGHWFLPWPVWHEDAAARDKNGVAVFADFELNLLVVVRGGVPRAFATLVESNSEVATFQLDAKKEVFTNISRRRNELVVINGPAEYTALVIEPGQAEVVYNLMARDCTQPMSKLLAGSPRVQTAITNFLIRTLDHADTGQMKENEARNRGAPGPGQE
jgi:hypothetical protein